MIGQNELKKIHERIFLPMQKFIPTWLIFDVIFPFVISRFSLIIVGYLCQYLPLSTYHPGEEIVSRGWFISPNRILDIWGRWDTEWYLDIIQKGYEIRGDITTTSSNIAFFPLYPYTVKYLSFLIPESSRSVENIFVLGVFVSNIMFLFALALLYKLIKLQFDDSEVARRSVLYLLIFPTSFFFSCFYTESAFLLISIGCFYAAHKRAWLLSSIFGALLTLCRPLGILVIIPLIYMYFKSINWQVRRIQWKILYFLLIPMSFFSFLLSIYHVTNNLFAPMQIQQAWNRSFTLPWITIINPNMDWGYITHIDRSVTLAFIFLTIISVIILKSISYSIYSFLLLLPPLCTGTLLSMSRYVVIIFPIFITMAFLGKRKIIDQFFMIIFLILQSLFMISWSQFYWVA